MILSGTYTLIYVILTKQKSHHMLLRRPLFTLTPPLGFTHLQTRSEKLLYLVPINDLEEVKLPYSSLAPNHSSRLPRRRWAGKNHRNLVFGAGWRPAGAGFCIV